MMTLQTFTTPIELILKLKERFPFFLFEKKKKMQNIENQ